MYGSLTEWRAYAAARGNTAPGAATDPVATAALVRASDYVRSRYVVNLASGYSADAVPSGAEYSLSVEGAYIAASFELATPGFFSKTFTPSQQKVLTRAGAVAWSVVGNGANGIYGATPISTSLDALFRPYIIDRDRPSFNMMSIGGGCF